MPPISSSPTDPADPTHGLDSLWNSLARIDDNITGKCRFELLGFFCAATIIPELMTLPMPSSGSS